MALKPYRATSHWKKIRLKVLNRDAWTCNYCGESANEVDHVYPKSKGGEDTLDNLVAACRRCNIKKKDAIFLGSASTPLPFASITLQNIQIGLNRCKTDTQQSTLMLIHPLLVQVSRGLIEEGT
jgi:hypothetical protein